MTETSAPLSLSPFSAPLLHHKLLVIPSAADAASLATSKSSTFLKSRSDPTMDANSGLVVQRLPSDQEWEDMQPLIRRFYLDEQRNLPDVVEIVKDTYGFKATVQMYKKRITRWGFRKYSRPEEKDAALDQIRGPRFRDGSLSTTLNGVTIKATTARRYAKRRRRISQAALPEQLNRSEIARRGAARLLQSSSPVRPLNGAADAASMEYVLWAIKCHFYGAFDNKIWIQRGIDEYVTSSRNSDINLSQVPNQIIMAFQWLRTNDYARARVLLSTLGTNARAMLQSQDIDLCCTLFEVVMAAKNDFPEYRSAILGYFRLESETLYGRRHPLSILLSFMCLSEAAELSQCDAMIKYIMRDCFKHRFGWNHVETIIAELDVALGADNDLDKIRNLLSKCDTHLGRSSSQSLQCVYNLCWYFYRSMDDDSLEAVAEELLKRSAEARILQQEFSFAALKYLERLYRSRRNWPAAERLLKDKILPLASIIYGIGDALYAGSCRRLISCLHKQGKWEEADEAEAHLDQTLDLIRAKHAIPQIDEMALCAE